MQSVSVPLSQTIVDEAAPVSKSARKLAELLQPYRDRQTLLLALPEERPTLSTELAHLLRLPFDTMVSHEFYLPGIPLVPAGALSEGGGLYFNAATLRLPGVQPLALWSAAGQARRQVAWLLEHYRQGRPLPPLNRRTVILIKTDLGSGLAALAAIQALHYAGIRRCVVATAASTPPAAKLVAARVDTLLTLHVPTEQARALGETGNSAFTPRQKLFA
jgi:putative phosphoribosyl transferase